MAKHFNLIDYCLVLVGRKTETSSGELHTGPALFKHVFTHSVSSETKPDLPYEGLRSMNKIRGREKEKR